MTHVPPTPPEREAGEELMESNFVETRGGVRMHYLQQGTGFPVIMLHGFPETSYQWRHQIPVLAEEHAVFAVDTRGFGKTDKPRIRVNRDMLARDIINFMEAVGIERAHLVGHDWGGIIGFKAVIDYQDRFERVAFIDTLLTTWIPWGFHGYWFKDEPRPEQFFAEHHEEFIDSIFAGKPDSYPGWPVSGFGAGAPLSEEQLQARAVTRNRWADDEAAEHYRRAFADPGVHFHAIEYYRHALPFHIVHPDPAAPNGERYEPLSEMQVAEMWNTPGGLTQNSTWKNHYMDYGPEDRHKRFPRPALYIYSPFLVPQAWPEGPSGRQPADDYIPAGNPYADQFSRYFPDLRCRGVPVGHFIQEEAPEVTTATLVKFFAGAI
jgi:pimeloyl-ACP methyl ester carboxylesterase